MKSWDISEVHGKEMYIIALEHAISMFKIAGEDALPRLKSNIKEVEQEIKEIEEGEDDN